MEVLRLKVTILGIKGVYRIIEATGNCTFDDLHYIIFEAFGRDDDHLYSFFITRENTQSVRKIYNAPEITHPMNLENQFGFKRRKKSTYKTKIGKIGLQEKDIFYYLFDFGDEWWHRIRVESIKETKDRKKSIKIIKSVGDAPPQYDYLDEDEE